MDPVKKDMELLSNSMATYAHIKGKKNSELYKKNSFVSCFNSSFCCFSSISFRDVGVLFSLA